MDYSELYKDYFPRLVQQAALWLPREDAEDMVQDVLVRLWERREALQFLADLYPYAQAAVRNKCLDRLKHQAYVREHQRSVWAGVRLAFDLETPVAHAEYRELEHQLNQAVRQLPVRCRLVFMMSRMEGKHNVEIARELGISSNTVECHITSALSRLRNKLKIS